MPQSRGFACGAPDMPERDVHAHEFAGGNYVLVTSLDGFDLPRRGGPYSSMLLSSSDQLIEHQEYLKNTRQLIYWFAHAARVTDR